MYSFSAEVVTSFLSSVKAEREHFLHQHQFFMTRHSVVVL